MFSRHYIPRALCRALSRATHGLRKTEPGSFRVLILHSVPEHDVAALDRLLGYIGEHHGFVSPEDVESAILRDGEIPAQKDAVPCLVTFDDGLASNAQAASIVEKHGARAVFFVCPALVDLPPSERAAQVMGRVHRDSSWPVPAEREVELMEWADLATLAGRGHRIGSHTATHSLLSETPPDRVAGEIWGAARTIEARVGKKALWFAYPTGRVPLSHPHVLSDVAACHAIECTGIRGLNAPRQGPRFVFRDGIDLRTPLDYQAFVLGGGLDFRYARARRALTAVPRARQGTVKGIPEL